MDSECTICSFLRTDFNSCRVNNKIEDMRLWRDRLFLAIRSKLGSQISILLRSGPDYCYRLKR
jgi:hypothetical protein